MSIGHALLMARALAVAAIVLAGCSSSPGVTTPASTSFLEVFADSGGELSIGGTGYETIVEAMPHVYYARDGGEPFAYSDLYVSGPVLAVEPGIGFNWIIDETKPGSGEQELMLEFDDDTALLVTIHVTVRVDRTIASDADRDVPEEVTFGLALDPSVSLDAIRAELAGYPALAVLLYESGALYSYDPDVWAVNGQGAFVGIVDATGGVTFPGVDNTGAPRRFIPRDLTLDELETPPVSGPIALTYSEETGDVRVD